MKWPWRELRKAIAAVVPVVAPPTPEERTAALKARREREAKAAVAEMEARAAAEWQERLRLAHQAVVDGHHGLKISWRFDAGEPIAIFNPRAVKWLTGVAPDRDPMVTVAPLSVETVLRFDGTWSPDETGIVLGDETGIVVDDGGDEPSER